MDGILHKFYAWILPIKIDWIEDMGLFFMLIWWDGYKAEYYAKMQKIMPVYRKYRELMRKIHLDAEPWQSQNG